MLTARGRVPEPDLLIVDLQMGNMGGMAVLPRAPARGLHGQLGHIPVLMLLDRRPDVFLARRSGAEGWIVKPRTRSRLRRAVTELLDGGTYFGRLLAAAGPCAAAAPVGRRLSGTLLPPAVRGHVRKGARGGPRPDGDGAIPVGPTPVLGANAQERSIVEALRT